MGITTVTEKERHLANILRTTTEALQAVTAERDALKADAERYRWLRKLEHCNQAWSFIGDGNANRCLDIEIDRAMKGNHENLN